ncbi:alpha/beta fold hydrolase [Inquilinus sp.]|uniref:alpha/beta hydrolase family protein n=1 Tax=Inquilinus sp. TaxID=1932117 RepID=UPI0031CE4A4C
MRYAPARFALALLALAGAGLAPQPTLAEEAVGVRTLTIPAPDRGTTLHGLLWYPAAPGGTSVLIGDDPPFRGTPARRDAPPAAGRFPLLLLSHGLGGGAADLGWISARLAAAGYIVAAPNHPGTTGGDVSPAAALQVWQRPADLSAVLDAIEAAPAWRDRIDTGRVGVLGFSLGGYTALAIAGARVDAAAYARYCDTSKTPMWDCTWLQQGGVDVHRIDAARFGRSNRDPRIAFAIAVDPALAPAYTAESLKGLPVPVEIINLGRPDTIPPMVAAAGVAAAIPGAAYETVPDAVHYSFLGECVPDGAALLKREGLTEPLCDDGDGRPRAALHAQLGRMIETALQRLFRRRHAGDGRSGLRIQLFGTA